MESFGQILLRQAISELRDLVLVPGLERGCQEAAEGVASESRGSSLAKQADLLQRWGL